MHRAILRLDVNKQAEFEVGFCSDKPLSVKAKMSLRVEDNQYSCTTIPVTVEAYQEILSLSNISRTSQEIDQEDDEEGRRIKEGCRLIMWQRKKWTADISISCSSHSLLVFHSLKDMEACFLSWIFLQGIFLSHR